MKKFILGLVVMAMIAGCSGLQATTAMSKRISDNAAFATQQASPTSEAAKEGLTKNSAILADYADTATVNVFAYWFDSEKQIYCTATYYTLLNKMSILGKIYDEKGNDGSYDDTKTVELYKQTNIWLIQVDDGIKGNAVER